MIAMVSGGQAEAQKKGKMMTVTGTVSDTTLSPVVGALIVVDGLDTGVTTTKSGTFKIKVSLTPRVSEHILQTSVLH